MGRTGHNANRRDLNEPDIIRILEEAGFQIYAMDKPCDLLCTMFGHNYLVEVKNGLKAKLTPPQVKFHGEWTGQKVILRTEEEARAWVTNVLKAYPHQFMGAIS